MPQVNSVNGESFLKRTTSPSRSGSRAERSRHDLPAVAVMARAPRPGAVKTRLCPPLTHAEAADLYACVLRDVLDHLAGAEPWDTWVAYAERSRSYFARIPGLAANLLPQRGGSLGARMHAVFTDLWDDGYRQVVVVGSDIPTLSRASVGSACDWLRQDACDVVLGPADDGGYYLIGLNRPVEELFAGVAWSTANVLDQTLDKARRLGLRVRMVARTYDIDLAADLERLRGDFEASADLRASRPRTRRWLLRRTALPDGG